MIVNTAAGAELSTEWTGAIRMLDRMKKLVVGSFVGGAMATPGIAMVIYNLPLLLAFDVLKQVLVQARDEKSFTCSGSQLGHLMECAKDSLLWIDWDGLRKGVRRRNEVAHDGKLFDSAQAIQDIESVEAQPVAWGIINADPDCADRPTAGDPE